MPSTIAKIVDGFPFPTIPPIVGVPNYESIAELHMKLNSNSASVQSNLGDSTLGLLSLTVSDAVYNTLSNIPFVAPENPGAVPNIPDGSTGPAIADIRFAFDQATARFNEYDLTDKALRQILLASIDETYVRTLRHRYTGYGKTSTRTMLEHLYANYANISPANLQQNDAKLRAPYDANHPIETLIDQVELAVEYSAVGKTPYSAEKVVTIAFQLVFQTGLFLDDCKLWKRKAPVEKTWANFKTFFALARHEWRKSLVTNAGGGFQSANHVYQQDTVGTIANLATATASDRASFADLTTTNGTLTAELTASNAKLVVALQEITKLTTTIADLKAKSGNQPSRQQDASFPTRHYCWTHGFRCTHPSKECPAPDTGHQTSAISRNTKGGSSATFKAAS